MSLWVEFMDEEEPEWHEAFLAHCLRDKDTVCQVSLQSLSSKTKEENAKWITQRRVQNRILRMRNSNNKNKCIHDCIFLCKQNDFQMRQVQENRWVTEKQI